MNIFQKALDKAGGTVRVDNSKNPLSAAARTTASIGKKNPNDPQNPKNKFQFATKQKLFGAPSA